MIFGASINCRCGKPMAANREAGGMTCEDWTPEGERAGLHSAIQMSPGSRVEISNGAIKFSSG